MEKNNSADSWFYFKPMVGGRITSGARKHKLFNDVRLVIGDFELPLQFKKIEATNLVKRTITLCTCRLYNAIERVHNARHKNVTSALNTTFLKTSGL